jgi:hypothetical protein
MIPSPLSFPAKKWTSGSTSPRLRKTLALVLAFAASSAAAADAPVILVREAAPLARIYVSPDDMRPETVTNKTKVTVTTNAFALAVSDLNYHFQQMAGASLEIVQESDAAKIPAPAVVVGSLARDLGTLPPDTPWKEGYRFLTRDNRVLIGGERRDAAIYGVYAFLNHLGCDWVMPGKLGEVIPRSASLAVPPCDVTASPDFGLRWMWIGGHPKHFPGASKAEFEQWRTRQRMGYAHEFRHRVNEAHMWQAVVAKYKEEFEKDPSMLALVRLPDGSLERRGPQLETANPKTVDLIVRFIREKFADQGWAKDEAVTLAVGPADGLDFSESPESLAAAVMRKDPVIGGSDATDPVVKLANDVLDRIGAEYPNLTLGYYVYSLHADFPARYTPNSRIYPIFAPISYPRLHSTLDPYSKTRAYYRHVVEQWSALSKKQGNKLMVYEYNWNLADNLLPYTRVRMIAEDLRYYKEKGLFGITVQAIKAWPINAPHDFIYARMAWDASLDWKALLADYCRKAFGPAASAFERYFLRLADVQQQAGYEAGSYWSTPLIFDAAYVKAARADIDAALASPGLTEPQRGRAYGVASGFRNLELYLEWNAAMTNFNFPEALRLGDALQTNYNEMAAFSPHFCDRAGGIYIQRLLLQSTRESLTFSEAPYRLIHRLPDALPTLLDPTSNGEHLNLFGPLIRDSDWIRTRTYSSTWDAQGLLFCREGSVWYRTRFPVARELAGQGIGLLLGAFEDEARVWVNGVYAGSTGIKFPQAAALDLTDGIRFGEDNLVAIQVKRNSLANELGLGGLLRPSFVFAGPRLTPAQPPAEAVRVLPGGETEPAKKGNTP